MRGNGKISTNKYIEYVNGKAEGSLKRRNLSVQPHHVVGGQGNEDFERGSFEIAIQGRTNYNIIL
jgi:hypothetical protein